METKQINIYDFDELSEGVKEKVLNQFRENISDCPYLEDNITERLHETLNEKGIKVLRDCSLRYSLGYCQGDGLSFIGDFEFKGIDFNIGLNSWGNHYQHSRTTEINRINEICEIYEDDGDITEELKIIEEQKAEEIKQEFKDIYLKICDKLEKEGYSMIEYENSDEAISDNIKANEYKFRENGDIEG